jgi:hypothetical protein
MTEDFVERGRDWGLFLNGSTWMDEIEVKEGSITLSVISKGKAA